VHNRPSARTEDLVTEQVEDGLVIYDQRNQTVHALSPEARAVWLRCDGRHSTDELAEQLRVEPAAVERALADLRASNLLEDMIDVRSGYSRREAAVKFAQVGGAAFVAPFVYSVSIASAATCVCSPNAPGCTPTSTPGHPMASTNCQGTNGVSGNTGKGCDCCSCACYESNNSTGTNLWCVSPTCTPGNTAAPGGDCTKCCSRACAGMSSTCSSGKPT
jgi:hypothetical protein